VGADWEQAFRVTPGLKERGVLLTPVVAASGTDIYRYTIYRVGAP
jgi:hypothetical protein